MKVSQKCYLISGQGPRNNMQDYGSHFLNSKNNSSFYLVADGIGGQPNGADAARITVESLKKYFQKDNIPNETSLLKQYLIISFQKAQEQLAKFIVKNPSSFNMGCAFCGIVISNKLLNVFWSGDCRLFVIRNGDIVYSTIPHTWSFDLYRQGNLSLEGASWSPQNYLTASINAFIPEIRFDVQEFSLEKKDKILICSDGIWNAFEQDELNAMLSNKSLISINNLITEYLKHYASDNYSGYLIEF